MIEAVGVDVVFRDGWRRRTKALDGFSITVEPGDAYALLGPNGAGKSTAIYCLLGLLRPDAGRVTVNGQTPLPGGQLFETTSYLPEEPNYHLYLTVGEAAEFYSSLYGRRIAQTAINEALERVGLAEHRHKRLSFCSKGMKQKLGIAVAMLNEPSLLILDEPTRGLDPLVVKEFREILLEMNSRGCTLVISSHVLSEVEMVCNRAAVIDRGRVLAEDLISNLTATDSGSYQMLVDAFDPWPEYVTVRSRAPHNVRLSIPEERLQEFTAFAGEKGLRVYECTLSRISLEDALFNTLKGGRA